MFRAMYRDDKAGIVIADEILKNYAKKKIAIIHDRSAYGQGVAEYVRDQLNKAGVKEIVFESYDPATHDYSVLVTRLKDPMGTEVLFHWWFYACGRRHDYAANAWGRIAG